MAKTYCKDCGEKSYNDLCTNCDEVCYIEDQYIDLGMDVPESIAKESSERKLKKRLDT